MILSKPLVRLTTVHYQSAVSMISFAQVLTAQSSDTIPCWNAQFQVRITSHNIPFQQYVLVQGEGYNDMSEYIKVEMRLSLCVD